MSRNMLANLARYHQTGRPVIHVADRALWSLASWRFRLWSLIYEQSPSCGGSAQRYNPGIRLGYCG